VRVVAESEVLNDIVRGKRTTEEHRVSVGGLALVVKYVNGIRVRLGANELLRGEGCRSL
jgi:hypothetical protein